MRTAPVDRFVPRFAVVLAALVLPEPCFGEVDRELLRTAIQAHKSSVESIQTIFANVKHSTSFEGKQPHSIRTADYWREPGEVRIVQRNPNGEIINYRQSDGKVQSISSLPTTAANQWSMAMVVDEANNYDMLTDVWKQAMFQLPRLQWASGSARKNPMKPYSLGEAMERLEVTQCAWIGSRQNRLAEIKLKEYIQENKTTWAYRIQLDPKTNWLAKEIEFTVKTEKYDWRCQFFATAFAELRHSIYFPMDTKSTFRMDGADPIVYDVEFSNVVINKPVKLPFPKNLQILMGLKVTNRIEGIGTQGDEFGTRMRCM